MNHHPTPIRPLVALLCLLAVFGQLLHAADAVTTAPATSADGVAPDPHNPNFPYIGKTNPQGQAVRAAKASGHISNYEEARAGNYTLPDPLKLASGVAVTDATTWFTFRRPEIINYYSTEIYGRVPATAPKMTFAVTGDDPQALEGTAIHKQLTAQLGESDGATIMVNMYLPAHATGPVPLVLSISFGFGGNTTNTSAKPTLTGIDPTVAPHLPTTGRPTMNFAEPIADILAHGYGYAIVHYTDFEGDTAAGSLKLARKLALVPGQAAPAADEWGTISAWAWGLSRIMDYLETDQDVDAKRVAIVGHSRLGKTVLWAGATDPRFAIVFSSQGGELGSALGRRDYGETIDDMAQNFPWQFAGNLQKYAGHWNEMPVDTHFLISLIAPRPLLITGGTGDQWSDPHGEFLGEVAAGPVYRLVGAKDLGTTEWPKPETPLISGDLAYYYHTGPHAITKEDWVVFLNFVDKYWKPKP